MADFVNAKVERKVEGKLKISILTPPLAKDLNRGLAQTREQHGKTSVKFNLGADEREHFLQDEKATLDSSSPSSQLLRKSQKSETPRPRRGIP